MKLKLNREDVLEIEIADVGADDRFYLIIKTENHVAEFNCRIAGVNFAKMNWRKGIEVEE